MKKSPTRPRKQDDETFTYQIAEAYRFTEEEGEAYRAWTDKLKAAISTFHDRKKDKSLVPDICVEIMITQADRDTKECFINEITGSQLLSGFKTHEKAEEFVKQCVVAGIFRMVEGRLFVSDEYWIDGSVRAKVKRPIDRMLAGLGADKPGEWTPEA